MPKATGKTKSGADQIGTTMSEEDKKKYEEKYEENLGKFLVDIGDALGNDYSKLGIFLGLGQSKIDNIETDNPKNSEKWGSAILTTWQRDNPNSLSSLAKALGDIGRKDLKKKVEEFIKGNHPYLQSEDADNISPIQSEEGGSTPIPNSPHPTASYGQAAADKNDDLDYPWNEDLDYPGLALIINNFTKPEQGKRYREGTKEDEKKLEKLFKNTLKFEVKVKRDLDKKSLDAFLKRCQTHLDSEDEFTEEKKYNCFVCVVLSHGSKDGIEMVSTNEEEKEYVTVDKIVDHFKPDKVKSLKGKPKIFIIQACQGLDIQEAVADSSQPTPKDVTKQEEIVADIIPRVSTLVDADIVIQYSTTKDKLSMRNPKTGSWFIEAFTDTVDKYHKKEDLLTMMTRVNKTIEQKRGVIDEKEARQMPCIVSTLTGRVYFH